ncbi:MAG: FixH family protein [Gemmatimonadota bacterium]
MRLRAALSHYRWPIYLGGLLTMSVVAHGVLVYVATRPDTPRPIGDYYQRSLEWDADEAVRDASRQLGWTVGFEVPGDTPHAPGMPRPVDVHVLDRDGAPVRGLTGQLQALRPGDGGRGQSEALTEMPHLPGTYRTLLRLDQPGLWEFRLDTRRQALRFVYSQRLTLTAETALSGGGNG